VPSRLFHGGLLFHTPLGNSSAHYFQFRLRHDRFSEEQIIGILKEAEAEPVKTVCALHNVSQGTYYQWKNKYGGMEVEEARRLRALEDENARLKRVVADQAVQIQILKEVNAKKW
jgi:putative transposase